MYARRTHNNTFRVRLRVGHLRSSTRHTPTLRSVLLDFMSSGWLDEDRDADAVLVIRLLRKAPLSDLSLHARTVRGQHITLRDPRYSDPSTPPPLRRVRTMTDRQQRNFRVAFHMDGLWRVTQGLQASLQGLRLRKPGVAFGNARDRTGPGPLCWRTETQASFRYQQPVGSVGYVGHPGFPWAVTGGRPADRHRRNDSRGGGRALVVRHVVDGR
jgi:hypothetical protein